MTEIENVANYMRRHSLVLATAESCTAGLIASQMADLRGAGSLLECAFVVYSPSAKQNCLGISDEVLRRYNLTSEEVASAMVRGAAARCKAAVVIANTGVADDAGDGVAAGTQCFAWLMRAPGCQDGLYTETQRFSGERNAVRETAARYALERVPYYHAQWVCRGSQP
jgi:nicotinamide-nucleotide amidase